MAKLNDNQRTFVEALVSRYGTGKSITEILIESYRLAYPKSKNSTDTTVRTNAYRTLSLEQVRDYHDVLRKERWDMKKKELEAIGATDKEALAVLGKLMHNAQTNADVKIKAARIIIDYSLRKHDNAHDGAIVQIIDDFGDIYDG